MYKSKPLVKNPEYRKLAKERSLKEDEAQVRESNQKKSFHEEKTALAKESIGVSREIAETISKTSVSTDNVLESLRDKIAQIRLEIPKSEDGDKVSQAISENTHKVEQAIDTLTQAVSTISLETQTIDLKPHTQEIARTISDNMDSLKTSIKELTNSVKGIEFEHPPLVMLSYRVTRNSDGYIEEIHPIAPDYK